MPLGLLDLSIVTDRLIKQLKACTAASHLWVEDRVTTSVASAAPFTIHYTGLPPDIAETLGDCHLSVYLFHVAPDRFNRNTFPRGGRSREIPEQPLGLTLYYLLSAHSKKSYVQEQQAMSIALKCFHDHPIITATVSIDGRGEEFTLTMEGQSVDEIGRLWQATASPLRLSAVYRASVVFLEPEEPTHPEPKLVLRPQVTAYPQTVVAMATMDPGGRVTITGAGFVAPAIVVQVDGVTLPATTTDPPEHGRVRFVDATTLDVQLATGTRAGPHRLSVQPAARHAPALFTLLVPTDVL